MWIGRNDGGTWRHDRGYVFLPLKKKPSKDATGLWCQKTDTLHGPKFHELDICARYVHRLLGIRLKPGELRKIKSITIELEDS